RSEEDLRRVNFVVDGRIFRLSDIATVKRGYSDPPQPLFRYNGTPAIGLGIAMRSGGDVLALGRSVEAAMTKITANLPVGIEPRLVADQPRVVESAVDDFMEALWEAIAIVLGVSFLSLGLRAGAVVACSIPLVLAAVFVAMEIAGIDLQRVSLGALIIALGLSCAVSVIFAPLLGVAIVPATMKHKAHTEVGAVMRRFRSLLVKAMRARWITISGTLALLALSALALRFVPQQFFPASDRLELLVNLTLSRSASIYASDRTASRFEALLKGDSDVDHWTTYVGQGAV